MYIKYSDSSQSHSHYSNWCLLVVVPMAWNADDIGYWHIRHKKGLITLKYYDRMTSRSYNQVKSCSGMVTATFGGRKWDRCKRSGFIDFWMKSAYFKLIAIITRFISTYVNFDINIFLCKKSIIFGLNSCFWFALLLTEQRGLQQPGV